MNRPLWQLLNLSYASKVEAPLSCEECFLVLEYYADRFEAGQPPDALQAAVREHLARCDDCRQRMESWIDALQSKPRSRMPHD